MVFSFYHRLTPEKKKIYRRSDEITSVILPGADELRPMVRSFEGALKAEDRRVLEHLCRNLAAAMALALGVPPVRVRVLAVRPSSSWGELHGLYELSQGRSAAVLSLWMRTVRQKRVVAFRTLFRTFLHEFCHHLDYELFGLPESFHTEGFYKRESSLFHQLVAGRTS